MVRILIVEDDRHFANVLACMLGWDGHEVAVANNATEGISQGLATHPDVVVVAWRLKGEMHGGEVCRRIHAAWPNFKAIVITGHQEYVYEAHQYCKCVAAVLIKPFHRDEILEAVRRALLGEMVFASVQFPISPDVGVAVALPPRESLKGQEWPYNCHSNVVLSPIAGQDSSCQLLNLR